MTEASETRFVARLEEDCRRTEYCNTINQSLSAAVPPRGLGVAPQFSATRVESDSRDPSDELA
jgi:hypothetical protein